MSTNPSTTTTTTNITIPGGAISNSTIRTGKLSVGKIHPPTIKVIDCYPRESEHPYIVEIRVDWRFTMEGYDFSISPKILMLLGQTVTGAFDFFVDDEKSHPQKEEWLDRNDIVPVFIGFEKAEDAALFQIMLGGAS
ncbi:hypothetical protein K7W03_23475 [Sphingobium sp. PNB]|uniref:hypothetical protein n=1 Tax=Sphingobium sp. PNB TaxID=863934 RepID=UPI001CA3F6FB|nr:hypothetical protein [Sphingobium sp. PNB]MCB4862556.1 hypothetical protein [Sphingobium sp. PNB]